LGDGVTVSVSPTVGEVVALKAGVCVCDGVGEGVSVAPQSEAATPRRAAATMETASE
jgi:hypothetical protein